MHKRKFTVVTQLHEKNNSELIEYLDGFRAAYASAYRETYYSYKNSSEFNKSAHNTVLQNKYGIMKRTANSIIADATGRYHALRELKKYEKRQSEGKLFHLVEDVLPELLDKKQEFLDKINNNEPYSVVQYRNLKSKIFWKRVKINKLRQKIDNLSWQIATGNFRICFGTKKLLQRDYEAFVNQRDSQLLYVGSRTETACNQMLQLSYDRRINQFSLKLRKDYGGFKDERNSYIFGKVYFGYNQDLIVRALQSKDTPLSYRFINKRGRWYLYCTFEITLEDEQFMTVDSYGTIGLDFNKGFVTFSETNKYGHLVDTGFYSYRFKRGSATKTDLEAIANKVVARAIETGKDVCIEGLDFRFKKSKTESKRGSKYNEMLHSLAYSSFMSISESVAFRNRVYVKKVNPAWTSWLAREKYCRPMKLNIHTGASFVIARRGQGFVDTV